MDLRDQRPDAERSPATSRTTVPGVARPQEDRSVGLGQERQDLSAIELGNGCGLVPVRRGPRRAGRPGPVPTMSRSSTQARAWTSALTLKTSRGNAVGVEPVDGVIARR